MLSTRHGQMTKMVMLQVEHDRAASGGRIDKGCGLRRAVWIEAALTVDAGVPWRQGHDVTEICLPSLRDGVVRVARAAIGWYAYTKGAQPAAQELSSAWEENTHVGLDLWECMRSLEQVAYRALSDRDVDIPYVIRAVKSTGISETAFCSLFVDSIMSE